MSTILSSLNTIIHLNKNLQCVNYKKFLVLAFHLTIYRPTFYQLIVHPLDAASLSSEAEFQLNKAMFYDAVRTF